MRTAVCTLVVGERFQRLFDEFSARSWQRYCQAHDYELLVFDRPFAALPGKSFAWQKLFLLEQPELEQFDRVIWLDADIIIAEGAPALDVPPGPDRVVRESPFTGSVESWYALRASAAPDIVQTGVLSLEHQHRPLLREALAYPETVMYEMPALSWCISQSGAGYRLDPRFNALLGTIMLDYAPRWMVTNKLIKETLWALRYPRAIRLLALYS